MYNENQLTRITRQFDKATCVIFAQVQMEGNQQIVVLKVNEPQNSFENA